MSDLHEPGRDTARLDDTSPPPGPWWSQPEGTWGAPGQDRPREPFGTPPAQPPYGSYAEGEQIPREPDDPWRSPSSTAVFGTGAPTSGYPTDTIGGSPRKERRGRGGLATAALVLVTALLAGGVGGYLGARSADDGGLLDPSASLGSGSGSAPANVDRAPESVAGIAAEVLKSTVSIAVQGGGGGGAPAPASSSGPTATSSPTTTSSRRPRTAARSP